MRREAWDWPPEHGRFKKVEILPPRQPRIEVTIRKQRNNLPQRLLVVAAVAFLAVVLFRSPGGLLVLAALVGPSTIAALVFGLLLCVIVSVIQRKRGH
jgi:hypothetical protein